MKCIVLAGGTGDKMWPLSRRDYPKQFMNIKEDRSLLQETIGRNLSLCEEFFIMANISHSFIVEGQMKAFQGLKYRCFYEQTGRGTALPVILAALCCNPSELLFVINSDHFINGNGYQSQVVEAMELARNGLTATFVAKVSNPHSNFDFFSKKDDEYEFIFHKDAKIDKENYLVNTGLFITTAGELLRQVCGLDSSYYEKVLSIRESIKPSSRTINIPEVDIESKSIESILYKDMVNKKILQTEFEWMAIDSFKVFEDYKLSGYKKNTLQTECKNISIINRSDKRLVVANDVSNIDIVATNDAVYVTSKEKSGEIKDIIMQNKEFESFFMHDNVTYRTWGYREILKMESDFMVRKVVIFPGCEIDIHKHTSRSEHWSVIDGRLLATINEKTTYIEKNMSGFVPIGTTHGLANDSEENVVIIEVSVGNKLNENDFISITDSEEGYSNNISRELVKLEPAFKDYIWGGTKLRDIYGKKCDYDKIAESWELSAHESGNSIIASGKYKGRTFSDYIDKLGFNGLGWKVEAFDRFPILIKFIDALESLSIQVHPDDEYALKNEHELGKNEMWYVMEASDDAAIYLGLNKDMTKDELNKKINDNTILEDLNKIKVNKGDVYFVNAKTIHAIGKGVMVCEVQQNSNCTYRLYDYNRTDKFGKKRPLHLKKALDVANLNKLSEQNSKFDIEKHIGYNSMILARCKYFECIKYDIFSETVIMMDDVSFKSIIILAGKGIMEDSSNSFEFNQGDSFFAPAGNNKIKIIGMCTVLVTHI